MHLLATFATLLCIFALHPTSLHAQAANAGSVAGIVTDSTGAVIAGATITLTDKQTSSPRTAVSNDAGRYLFPNVPPGTYVISANKTGFRVQKITDLNVSVGSGATLDFKMEVGSVAETVEVTATGAELQTTNSTMGTTLSGESIYTPSSGSNSPQATGGAPSGVMPTPVESVEEFKVSTANQTADFNGASGAQVQLVTRRGGNQWHGAAYEYYLGANFGANTWDNNVNTLPKVATHQNRFGAAAGGPILPNMLGGKTYFFANYEGLRYPLASTFERAVPSATLRQGIITVGGVQYNFNPANGVLAQCAGGPCDPRGVWFNPAIQQIWSKFMPLPNDLTNFGDHVNVQGFKGTVVTPVKSDFGVARLDHDFGKNWHFMSSYRVYRFVRTPTVQTDIGGFFQGDKLGTITATAARPQKPWYLVAGVTTNITPNLTNDFHFSYLRNFWSWQDNLAPPQLAGIPGAIEISPSYGGSKNIAESANALIPYNVNTQSVRIRFWDGHDSYYRDDVSYIRGNHVWQIGGPSRHFRRAGSLHSRRQELGAAAAGQRRVR